MPRRNRLTNNSDETDIASLISGDTVFSIPYFQRAYRWKPERLKQLEADILSIVDENTDFHFLGAIIVHGRRSNPSDPDVYDVIDGQQRITTLFIYLCALVKTLCDLGEISEAAGLFFKYLVIGRDTVLASNLKLHSCKDDRAQLNYVFKDLLSNNELKEKLGLITVNFLASTGSDRGILRNNYRNALRFLAEQREQGGLDRIRAVSRAILDSMSVVQIDIWDPTNGPKIFDSLNSRQEPMTIGDLVRNEIFSRVADKHPDVIEKIDQDHWQPFYHKFQQTNANLFDRYFFPYGLINNPNLRKSEVYASLRARWENIADPDKIINELATYQNAFIDLELGSNYQEHKKNIAAHFKNLHDLGAPSSTLPFLMQLSNGARDGTVAESDCIGVLEVVESFLVRRAICGHEPTGLHAVFKRLWTDCNGKPTRDSVIEAIRSHKTVVWPDKGDVRRSITNRPLYGSSIAQYLLLEFDNSLKGDRPSNIPWIEHVLPETFTEAWSKRFTDEQHENLKDLIGNLVPLSQQMNIAVSNGPYTLKRDKYLKDSMFKSARELATKYAEWTPTAVEKRCEEIAEWANQRWQY